MNDDEAVDLLALLGDEDGTVLRCISCPCALVTRKAYRAPVACNYCFAALWWGKEAVFPPYSITCTRGGKDYRHE
jgi:hypothetical protein